MAGRIPFRGGRGPAGHGLAGRGPSGRGPAGRGPAGRSSSGRGPAGRGDGEHRADQFGSCSRPSQPTSSTTPMEYRLQDIPQSPDDSVGTSIPTDATLARRSGSSSSMGNSTPITTLAADAIIAQNAAAIAAAAATAAAELAETTAAAAAAAIAAAAAQANQDNNLEEDLLIPLRVVPGRTKRFEPSVASRLGQIIHENVCKEGSNWTKVTRAMKDFYFDEFKKYFKWPRSMDKPVKDCWKTVAGKQYRDFINDRKKDSEKKDYIPEDVWSRWTADWNTPEALELSRLKREARMGGATGQCSKHSGGSITFAEHARRLEKKLKRKPAHNELFDLTHRRKSDKAFVDEKSAKIDAAFNERKLELSQRADGSTMPTDDDIYLEVVGGKNKDGDVYGLGSQSSSVGQSSSSSEQPPVLMNVIQDIIQQAFIDFDRQNAERSEQRIGKEVESMFSPFQRTLLQMQELIARLPRITEATNPTQVSDDASDEEIDENEA